MSDTGRPHLVERAALRIVTEAGANAAPGLTMPGPAQARAGGLLGGAPIPPAPPVETTLRSGPQQRLAEEAAPPAVHRAPPMPDRAPPRPSAAAPPRAPATPPGLPPMPQPPIRIDWQALRAAGLVGTGEKRSRSSEEFRVIQSEVMRRIAQSPPPAGRAATVMVTSARPGEGKSFAALNLAASLAAHQERPVLLVDAHSKPAGTTDRLGQKARPGLLEVAANPTSPVRDSVVPTAVPGLAFLPLGEREAARTADSAQASPAAIIETLHKNFPGHIVIIDSAPCLASSDPATLAGLVDHTVMVVGARQTKRNEVEAALDLIHASENVMMLLNRVQTGANGGFGAYS